MKRFVFSLLKLVFSLTVSAVVAPPYPFSVSQPDGSSLTLVMKGNHLCHRTETIDGIPVLRDSIGFYRYAEFTEDLQMVPSAHIAKDPDFRSDVDKAWLGSQKLSDLYGHYSEIGRERQRDVSRKFASASQIESSLTSEISSSVENVRNNLPLPGRLNIQSLPGRQDQGFPSVGEQRAIVILAEYQDVRFSIPNPKDYFTRMLNEVGFSDYGADGSVRDYFISNSNGVFKPQFDVYGPIQLGRERAYYGGNDYHHNDKNPEMMVVEACKILNSQIDFSVYDRDDDGVIDNVFIFYAGRGEHDGGGSDAVWPHSAKLLGWLPETYVFDDVTLNRYACTCEIEPGFDRPAAIGTFIHEFCHVLGLPDLYATNYSGAYTPGPYSILDQGPYNNGGLTPPAMSSFERGVLGWLIPDEFGSEGNYTLKPVTQTNRAYIIPSEYPSEYYLLENRQQEGYDRYIPGHGMLVWHITYDKDAWDAFAVNNAPEYQLIDLIESDGSIYSDDRDGHPFPGSNGITTFGYNTIPSLHFNLSATPKINLSEIEEINGDIRFVYNPDAPENALIGIIPELTEEYTVSGTTIEAKAEVSVYTVTGFFIGRILAGEALTLPQSGIYLIKGSSTVRKLFVQY